MVVISVSLNLLDFLALVAVVVLEFRILHQVSDLATERGLRTDDVWLRATYFIGNLI